ncbi:MAG: hypothetical protein E7046_05610 [Lentisphaerae bacterium]|nr:hypothetical protein [Lentisphaerota bacterium]
MFLSGDGGYMMKEHTARELMEEILHQAESLPSGLECKVVIGDVVSNHSDARNFEIQSDAEMDAIRILCDPDEVVHLITSSMVG